MWKNLMDDATERGLYESVPIECAYREEPYLQQYIERVILLPK